MLISANGVKPDPAKVDALEYLESPKNKEELISFLCMMQSNSDFIPNFAKRSARLRELTRGKTRFQWTNDHEKCFRSLLEAFRKDALLRFFDMSKPTYIITDAHITGLGAILAQGDDLSTAKPVAFASRTTNSAETRYPQLDLEAMGLDFGLRRFRNYLVGAPEMITCVTDHKPLCAVFNGKKSGSFRTERIKLRHQDIRFHVIFQPGKSNQTDFISRHARPFNTLSQEEQHEADDLNNLLYVLHTTPVIDHISLATISEHTATDPTLKHLTSLIKEGKTWIHKSTDPKFKRFQPILPEITITGNGILLKGDRIILPESLQETSINIAHRGSHVGQSGIQRRLRSHFFFHDMNAKVQQIVNKCIDCQSFSSKKTNEPIQCHPVPQHCWERVAVDLFGPMPSSHHVVVVQDLASRYPVAKLVSSTKATKVIPALQDIYDTIGNPEHQLSDNGPPFNSRAMQDFATMRGINLQKIPPLHPSANPVETFMKPLGKTMKIAHHNKVQEKAALNKLLMNYRDTPHPATGIAPAAMLFRDSQQSQFPRQKVSNDDVLSARRRDTNLKTCRQEEVNSSKYRRLSHFQIGDSVLMRNHKKTSKFDPVFLPEPCIILDTDKHGRCLVIERQSDGHVYKRHPDDVKLYLGNQIIECQSPTASEQDIIRKWHQMFESMNEDLDTEGQTLEPEVQNNEPEPEVPNNEPQEHNPPRNLRVTGRIRKPTTRYFNDDFTN